MCTRNAPTVIRNTEDSRYTYHSRLLEDSYHPLYSKDHVEILHDLIQTLKDAKVPGPTLFRLRSEFTDVIETGGESEIRGIGLATLRRLREGDPKGVLKWPVEGIAIKQHKPRQLGSSRLGSRFLAAKREVLALAPLFDKHPNIVRLLGWGICLDTIEHPLPGSLQIPLLVLERAETDLYRFLTQNTPETTPTLGYWERYRMGRAPHLVDTELGDTHIIHRSYDLLRRLCIDVGNGVQALHEYNLAHGDLKPQNVLIFKTQGGWVAKLCDFGCTRGVVDSSNGMSEGLEQSGSTKIGYAGTKGWLPPETGPLGHDKIEYKMLQKCDIYAYGLLIWSVFCKAGNSPILEWNGPELVQHRPDYILERALNDVNNMVSHESKSLAITLKDILEDTLQLDPNERSMTPWVRLHTSFENSIIRVRELWKSSRLLAKSTLQMLQREQEVSGSPTSAVPHPSRPRYLKASPVLTPEQKQRYMDLDWWVKGRPFATTSGKQLSSPNRDLASREALTEDEDFRSLSNFQSANRQAGVARFYDTIKLMPTASRHGGEVEDYCYARFRSRIPLTWWAEHADANNIVKAALSSSPAVEFSTLAWLCRGEIGISEVQRLPNDYQTWKVILDRKSFNESERLERFLLLLQFGARVELKLYVPGLSPATILVQYIRSCRPVTISTVTKEICRRFKEVEKDSHILISTRQYIRGHMQNPGQSNGPTAYNDFLSEDIKDACTQLYEHRYCSNEVLYSPFAISSPNPIVSPTRSKKRHWFNVLNHSPSVEETRPLLRLPEGWEQVLDELFNKNDNFRCFRDVFTGSITLQRPIKSLLTIRQVLVGYNDPNNQEPCYIDTIRLIRSDTSRKAKAVSIERMGERFPLCDDTWFRMEQLSPLPSTDVLRAIPDPWKVPDIPAFATRLPSTNFISSGLEMISDLVLLIFAGLWYILMGLWYSSLVIGFMLVVVAILALVTGPIVALFMVRGYWAFLAWPVGGFLYFLALCSAIGYAHNDRGFRRSRSRRRRALGLR